MSSPPRAPVGALSCPGRLPENASARPVANRAIESGLRRVPDDDPTTEANGCSLWCGSRLGGRNDGDKAQRFCRPACRRALDAAGRRWIAGALASGALSSGDVRNGSLTTRALLPCAEAQAPAHGQSAPVVAPPERPDEAAEDSPFTETWEFRAMVAEAVVAALVETMPRIIVAAMTGNTS